MWLPGQVRLRNPLEDPARRVGFLLELGEHSVDYLHRILLVRRGFSRLAYASVQRRPSRREPRPMLFWERPDERVRELDEGAFGHLAQSVEQIRGCRRRQ